MPLREKQDNLREDSLSAAVVNSSFSTQGWDFSSAFAIWHPPLEFFTLSSAPQWLKSRMFGNCRRQIMADSSSFYCCICGVLVCLCASVIVCVPPFLGIFHKLIRAAITHFIFGITIKCRFQFSSSSNS